MSFFQDLRYALRVLAKQPGFTLLAVVTLGLGIGLTATMFSIVRGALVDLPFPEADRLVHLERNNLEAGQNSLEVPGHDFVDWRTSQQSLVDIGAFYQGTMNLAGPETKPERYSGGFVTASVLELLQAKPALGRLFRADDELPGAPQVAILGWELWQNRFGGDPGILGKTVRINSAERTVVGIMAEGFAFPIQERLWLPLVIDLEKIKRGEGMTYEVIGRLKPGVTLEAARAELATIANRVAATYPDTHRGMGSVIKPFTDEYVGDEPRNLLITMLIAVSGVLLIACANVANLLLSRALLRGKEVAVRSVMGASRGRLITQILGESLVLATGGALLGLALASFGVELFNRSIASTEPPFWLDIRVNGTVVAFVALITVLTALAAGLAPALQASRRDAGSVLKDEGRGSAGLRLSRLSHRLVIAEIALSFGLLMASGLLIKSVTELRFADWGFDTRPLATGRLALFATDYPEPADRLQLYESLLERLETAPGIDAVALAESLPVLGSDGDRLEIEGRPAAEEKDLPAVRMAGVSPAFFATLGVTPLSGRVFERADRPGNLPVAVVNQSLVAKHFPQGDALGKRIRLGGPQSEKPWLTIVGIVPDLYMDGANNEEPEGLYTALFQDPPGFVSLVARTPGPPNALQPTFQQTVSSLDPNMPVYWGRSLNEAIALETWFFSVFGTLFAVFGGVALFLAGIGLYGVMSFSVAQRKNEVGIRMAMGAEAGQVQGMILRQGARQLVIGAAFGIVLALLLGRALGFLLFNVSPADPLILVTIFLVLSVTALVACLLPARRAARTSPMTALR